MTAFYVCFYEANGKSNFIPTNKKKSTDLVGLTKIQTEVRYRMEEQQTKNKNSLKIILIIVISAVVLAAVAVTAVVLLKKTPEIKTQYGSVKNVFIDSDSSFTVRLSAPYSSNGIEYVSDSAQKCYLKNVADDKRFETVTGEIKYSANRDDEVQEGTVEITFEVKDGFSFENEGVYQFEMPDKTVNEKNGAKSVGAVNVEFRVESSFDGNYYAFIENSADYDVKQTTISNASIEKQDDKFFLCVEVEDDELIKLNESGIEAKTAGVFYSYTGESISIKSEFEGVALSTDESGGVLEIRCPIKKEDVIAGTEYTVVISQGLLINDDMTLANSEMSVKFTYMG